MLMDIAIHVLVLVVIFYKISALAILDRIPLSNLLCESEDERFLFFFKRCSSIWHYFFYIGSCLTRVINLLLSL